jgi:hypothetical protein
MSLKLVQEQCPKKVTCAEFHQEQQPEDGCQHLHLGVIVVCTYCACHLVGCRLLHAQTKVYAWRSVTVRSLVLLLTLHKGDLHWIWKPYEIYQNIDYVYGLPALESGNGFTNAQCMCKFYSQHRLILTSPALMNIVETSFNLLYIWQAHVSKSPVAPLTGFASAVMTLSKTVLYWLQEYYCNYCAVGHNTIQDLIVYWIIPNG